MIVSSRFFPPALVSKRTLTDKLIEVFWKIRERNERQAVPFRGCDMILAEGRLSFLFIGAIRILSIKNGKIKVSQDSTVERSSSGSYGMRL